MNDAIAELRPVLSVSEVAMTGEHDVESETGSWRPGDLVALTRPGRKHDAEVAKHNEESNLALETDSNMLQDVCVQPEAR